MTDEKLTSLRLSLDELDFGEADVEPIARAILSRDPSDPAALNALRRTLLQRGELEEALEVYGAGLDANPANRVANDRVREIRHQLVKGRILRANQERRPRRSPEEIVEPVLKGAGRTACLALLAWSIRETERLDASRLAVTDIQARIAFVSSAACTRGWRRGRDCFAYESTERSIRSSQRRPRRSEVASLTSRGRGQRSR